MELSTAQRFVAFTAAVLVLAGLGVSLFLPQRSAAGGTPPGGSPSAGQRPHQSSPSQSPSGPASPGGTTSPAPGAADIYQWLPFTQSGLTSAARLATDFSDDYGTFSYSQSTTAYLAPMKPLMTTSLYQVIGRAFAAPGVASTRTSRRQVCTATAGITSLRAFGPTSITFVVAITQRISDTKGHSQQVTDYAITLTSTTSSWL